MSISLGPFQLLHPIGKGGMGVVWLGQHTEQGVPVAVKVITGRVAGSIEYQHAFRKEVRSVSSLDHPGIVWVFDYGRIPRSSAEQSDMQLVEGSPYLVMEYASRGTLRSLNRILTWPELRSVLMTLLDALAHAHARGVIHRDLKPDNVLIAGTNDLRPGFKLTDFGIAAPIDYDQSTAGEDRPVGTPHYMAPEQIRGDFTRYGPHTDLYALGCLTYRLVAGRLPFQGLQGPPLMYAQLTKPAPPLEPRVEVPSGFEAWLSVLMAKGPEDRFQRAADAALALARLKGPEETGFVGVRLDPLPGVQSGGDGLDTDLTTDRLKVPVDLDATATLTFLRAPAEPESPKIDPRKRPPLPASWRLTDIANRPLRLMGAGLGLFGLRPVPFVGRENERDELWEALSTVHKQGRAQVVIVRGAAGTGKTRLVQWVADRAHEVGGAEVVRSSFTDTNSSFDQLGRMVVRFLRAQPLSDEQLKDRLGHLVEPWVENPDELIPVTLSRLLDPDKQHLHDAQRLVLIRKVFEDIAKDRPLVVWFDDAQWGPDSLKLARHILEAQATHPCSVLMVLTVLDDVLEDYSEVSRLVEGIPRRQGGAQIQLGPLQGVERRRLVEELLGLDEALAARVERRTDGNPLFATQLVGDWVERGVLVSGPSGFKLQDPDHELPSSLQEVWEGRIRQLVSGLNTPALEMLERAAVLGRQVDIFEWQKVCDDPSGEHARHGSVYFRPQHARIRKELMDRLFANRLGRSTEEGFVFTHAMFRTALIDRSQRAGRWREHNGACASVLEVDPVDSMAERVGRHLVAAGRPEEAIHPLLRGVTHRANTRGHQAALSLLREVEATLNTARTPAEDPRWAQLFILRANNLEQLDQPAKAKRWAMRASRLASEHGWSEVGAAALACLGAVAITQGELEAAERHYLKAVKLLGQQGDPHLSIQVWHRLRELAHRRHDVPLARARGEEVRAHTMRAKADTTRAYGYAALSGYALAEGDLPDARACAQRSLSVTQRTGDLLGRARALAVLAEVETSQGELAQARDLLRRCIECYEELGSSLAVLVRCKWAMLEAKGGHFARAQAAVEPALAEQEPTDTTIATAAHVCLLMATAGRAKWPQFEQHLSRCERLFPELRSTHPSYARMAGFAGDLCIKRRQRDRAVRCWQLAADQWQSQGQTEHAATMLKRIATLGSPPA